MEFQLPIEKRKSDSFMQKNVIKISHSGRELEIIELLSNNFSKMARILAWWLLRSIAFYSIIINN